MLFANRHVFDVMVEQMSLSQVKSTYHQLEPRDKSNVLDLWDKKAFADSIWERLTRPGSILLGKLRVIAEHENCLCDHVDDNCCAVVVGAFCVGCELAHAKAKLEAGGIS